MLEIALLIWAGRKLANMARSKGRPVPGIDEQPVEELELVDRDPNDPYAPPRKI